MQARHKLVREGRDPEPARMYHCAASPPGRNGIAAGDQAPHALAVAGVLVFAFAAPRAALRLHALAFQRCAKRGRRYVRALGKVL